MGSGVTPTDIFGAVCSVSNAEKNSALSLGALHAGQDRQHQ